MDVIEISSSPEPAPAPGLSFSKRQRIARAKRRRRRPVPYENVIELTDSDEEPPAAGPSRIRRTQSSSAEPDPPQRAPLFLPDPDERLEKDVALPLAPQVAQPVASDQPPDTVPAAPLLVSVDDPPDSFYDGQPPADPDPCTGYLAHVLEIIPDVDPVYLLALIERHLPAFHDKVVEPVLHTLFENPGYPKADIKGKAKRKREDEDAEHERAHSRQKVDYTTKDRARVLTPNYAALSIDQLLKDFPLIPSTHIRRTFVQHNGLYAPTYLYLDEERKGGKLPYRLKATALRARDKGKGVARHDDEFERERDWLLSQLDEQAEIRIQEELGEGIEDDNGIECGCCFSTYPFDKMIQCPEAHLFCSTCMTSYASTLLGSHDPNIVCMDQSGCKLAFPESELRRFLTPKLLALYERVKQRKEIEAAGLEGLEECPFCEYKVVIDNPDERLFSCEGQDCGAVTCRKCKKADHLPKSCEEVEEDKKLDARHTIEEAMSNALMRNCPKCNKAFVKEYGCNKMTCPNCSTMSCYVCRKIITGYQHFANPPPYNGPQNPGKCQLWDSVEKRHSDDVIAAAKRAKEEYKRAHPEVDENDLQVDLPPPPPAPAAPAGYHPGYPHAHPAPFMPPMQFGALPPLPNLHAGLMGQQHRLHMGGQPLPMLHQLPPRPRAAIKIPPRAMRAQGNALPNIPPIAHHRAVPGPVIVIPPRPARPQPGPAVQRPVRAAAVAHAPRPNLGPPARAAPLARQEAPLPAPVARRPARIAARPQKPVAVRRRA